MRPGMTRMRRRRAGSAPLTTRPPTMFAAALAAASGNGWPYRGPAAAGTILAEAAACRRRRVGSRPIHEGLRANSNRRGRPAASRIALWALGATLFAAALAAVHAGMAPAAAAGAGLGLLLIGRAGGARDGLLVALRHAAVAALLALAATPGLPLWQTPQQWADLLRLTPLGAALALAVYGLAAGLLPAHQRRPLPAATSLVLLALPFVLFNGLFLLASTGLLDAPGAWPGEGLPASARRLLGQLAGAGAVWRVRAAGPGPGHGPALDAQRAPACAAVGQRAVGGADAAPGRPWQRPVCRRPARLAAAAAGGGQRRAGTGRPVGPDLSDHRRAAGRAQGPAPDLAGGGRSLAQRRRQGRRLQRLVHGVDTRRRGRWAPARPRAGSPAGRCWPGRWSARCCFRWRAP